MAAVKLTKNGLREQQNQLAACEKYLPTLQLKKALLQTIVNEVRLEVELLEKASAEAQEALRRQASLCSGGEWADLARLVSVVQVRQQTENVSGIEVPVFAGIDFADVPYSLFDTPIWTEGLLDYVKQGEICRARLVLAKQKQEVLERELRDVSIKVNLFEKILIPRAVAQIRTIRVYLGDQQLAAIAQAKVAKDKIGKRKTCEAVYAH